MCSLDHKESSPVFIISPTERSGTNFLIQALVTLGLCELPSRRVLTREDHLIQHSELLRQYVEETSRIWRIWEPDQELVASSADQLLRCIGDGILAFVGKPVNSGKSIILKTPNSISLRNFRALLPSCRLILLVRDGRDTAESHLQSWEHTRVDAVFVKWAKRTRELLDFIREFHAFGGDSWILVRYEDLFTDPELSFTTIATFLNKRMHPIDVDAISELPVFGSSEIGKRGRTKFEWRIEVKPADFNPIGRWRSWTTDRRDLFKKLAGSELIELGYESDLSW